MRYLNLTILLVVLSHLCAMSVAAQGFAKGADISWISEMEDQGNTWNNANGQQQDLLEILKSYGMTAVRLRVWVNPNGGWYSSIDDVVQKAQRAKNAGMDIMIDFHYSDDWADPGKQYKPSAWSNFNVQELADAVWQHTHDSLQILKDNGITPLWVQVGNETNDGMLWEEGRASDSMANYARFVSSGYDAVKAVFSSAQVIVHVSNCHDNDLFRWNIGGLRDNGANFDIIGASSYPTTSDMAWRTANNNCLSNLNDMASTYGKDVMVVEVGTPWNDGEAREIIADVISKVRQVNNGRGKGVFYWEPQAYNWNGYEMGAWNPDTRQPAGGMDAFLEGGNPSSSSSSTSSSSTSSSNSSSSSSSSSTSGNNTLVVRARGANGDENITLTVGGNTVQSWVLTSSMANYTASTNATGSVQVEFTNDGTDRDVQIDYVQVNGQVRQAEDQTENTGVWANEACGGAGNSEWLHCDGFISFGSVSGGATSSSSSSPSSNSSSSSSVSSSSSSASSGTNTIVVRAQGADGSENINLIVGGSILQSWTLTTSMASYTASTSNTGYVEVEFTNDEEGRDVQVDYIQVNGETRQAEDQTENSGVWANDACGGGSQSEWLHCDGAIGFGELSSGASQSSSSTSSSASSSSSSTGNNGGVCNWYGTDYPLCVTTTSGWGWEESQSCISESTCSSQ